LYVIFEIFENYLVNIGLLLKYLRREMWNSDQVSICHTALWVQVPIPTLPIPTVPNSNPNRNLNSNPSPNPNPNPLHYHLEMSE